MANQHYVPKFYFRMFTEGSHCIHVLLTTEGRIVKNASIRGQCANSRFYGPTKIEKIFSQLETIHRNALKQFIDFAWQPHPVSFEPKHLAWLWNAILFQRSRTELEIEKIAPAIGNLSLEFFKEHLKHKANSKLYARFIKAIEDGKVSVTEPPQATAFRSIAEAIQTPLLISDLDFHILRNRSDYPFVFSDAPVVFCNTYYQNVRHRGVLGLQTPGLQIFYPLNSVTLIMLNDAQVYRGNRLEPTVIDVIERSDVSQLNALQLHHSMNAVYFANADDEEYMTSFWLAHKNHIIPPRTDFGIREGWLVDGKPPDGILCHMFEPQLNITLDLSFIECTPADPRNYNGRKRSPELVEEHKRQVREN